MFTPQQINEASAACGCVIALGFSACTLRGCLNAPAGCLGMVLFPVVGFAIGFVTFKLGVLALIALLQ